MQTTELINVVQQRADIESTEAANDTLIAVLTTLAERDLEGEHENFAAQLPKEFGEVLLHGDPKDKETFDAEEFVRRIGERLGTTPDHTETRTRAAFSALVEGVSDGEQLDLLNSLPNDFSPYAIWQV
ncbi:MAG TPA: DUF2267 domain-containing protein [Candidatus Yaniella excrementigallinarum]|nr:DUF2267 domain-containing protein [Candidatus Yaniella excrementigallinarum]